MSEISDDADEVGSSMDTAGSKGRTMSSRLKSAGRVGAAGIAAVTTAVAGAVTGMGKLISDTAQYAQTVDKASAQSGVAAEKIQEIAYAAQQTSGASFDSVRDGLKELALRSEEAARGTGEAVETFEALGISQQFLQNATTSEVFSRVRKELQGASAQMKIFASETLLGGEAGQKLVETLGLSESKMKQLRKEAQESGKVLSGSQVKALERVQQSWTSLTASASGFGRQIAANLAPLVTNVVIPALRSLGHWLRDLTSGFDGSSLQSTVRTGIGYVQTFVRGTKAAANAVLGVWSEFSSGLQKVWGEWGGFILELAESAFENLLSAFRGVAGVVVGIWDTLVGTLTGNWSRAWEGIKGIVTSAVLTIAQGITGLVENILNVMQKLASYIPGVGETISSGLETARQSVEDFRESIHDANADASGLSSTWEGFKSATFGGGEGASSFLSGLQASASSSSPSVGGQGSGSSTDSQTAGMKALMHWTKKAGQALRSTKEKTNQMKNEGRSTAKILNRGFSRVFSGLGRMTAGLVTGKENVRSFGQVAAQALRGVITQLTTMIAKLGAIKGLKAAFSIGTGGIGGALLSAVGLASGGVVTGPTLSVIGEGREDEAVLPLSRLEQMIQPPTAAPAAQAQGPATGGGTVRSSSPARVSQGRIEIPVEVIDRAQKRGSRNTARTGRR